MLPLWRHPTGKVTPESDQLPTVAVFADQVLIGFRHVRELHVRGVPLQCRYGFVLSEILPADAHGRGGQGDGFRAVRGIDEVPRGTSSMPRTALKPSPWPPRPCASAGRISERTKPYRHCSGTPRT